MLRARGLRSLELVEPGLQTDELLAEPLDLEERDPPRLGLTITVCTSSGQMHGEGARAPGALTHVVDARCGPAPGEAAAP